MRGPTPKPTAIRKYEGNPSGRPLPKREPHFPGMPVRPKRMSAKAKPIWNDLTAQMKTSGLLCAADSRALAQLCEDEAILSCMYAGFWGMAATIKKEAAAQGKALMVDEVWVLLMQKAGRMAIAALNNFGGRVIIERREFGLTPSARSRIDAGLGSGGGSGFSEVDPLELKLCG
jgi:phage terminase small subunit